jgi:hypothetical protein
MTPAETATRGGDLAVAGSATDALGAMRAAEEQDERHLLAAALAPQLAAGESAVERGLREAGRHPGELAAVLARSTGTSEEQVVAAFETMARQALTRTRRQRPRRPR